MSEQVKVEDLEVFRLFRAALMKFAQAAGQAMSSADAEVTRAHTWLTIDQTTHWQGQFRRRQELVAAARQAVIQKKIYKDAAGKNYSAVEEEKALRRALAAVEEAQNKILAIRKALPKLENEAQLYRAGVAPLGGTVTGEIPKAVARLDRLAERLEAYIQLKAPSGMADPSGAGSSDSSFALAGEDAPVSMAQAEPEAPVEKTEQKEGKDVTIGE